MKAHQDAKSKFAPSRAALLVVDMQNDFCAEGGFIEKAGKDASACRAAAPVIGTLVEAARICGVPVVWTFADYSDDVISPPMRRRMQELHDFPCRVRGSWGAAPFGVQPLTGERIFQKHSYSLFSRTEAEPYLRSIGVDTLIFTGVQTNVCVESSLREAYTRGFFVAIVRDAVGSHARALHEATLSSVATLWGDVLTSQQVLSAWRLSAAESSSTENAP